MLSVSHYSVHCMAEWQQPVHPRDSVALASTCTYMYSHGSVALASSTSHSCDTVASTKCGISQHIPVIVWAAV